ncbi:unnamed protein product [Cuscuta epithymum]|uniref:Uncharacterized protein n=1 Tax=Cuscuta epithymum TaxID=186058 RepID=A0AAV0CU82_9ASTE|nr:unnamed protein product [Cuscuta epithymum]
MHRVFEIPQATFGADPFGSMEALEFLEQHKEIILQSDVPTCRHLPPTPLDLIQAALLVHQQLIHMKEEEMMKVKEMKLLDQKPRRYWEGRGSRIKRKFKIKAVSYYPP